MRISPPKTRREVLLRAAAHVSALGAVRAWSAPRKATVARPAVHVTMALAVGSLRDRGFHDAANRGLLKSAEELGVRATVLEPGTDGDGNALLEKALSKGRTDLVVCVGFPWSPVVRKLAAARPSQPFCVVDDVGTPGEELPRNLLACSFREEEAAYLVGIVAAGMTRTRKAAFVGGMDSPVMQRFARGFAAGTRAADARITVDNAWVDTTPRGFASPARGKELALRLFKEGGVDMLFHASGASGLGITEAARETGRFVLGVDRSFDEAPDHMPAVMTKDLGRAVFDAVKAVVEGTFQGGARQLGLQDGGVGITLRDRGGAAVPPAILGAVEVARAEILAGRVKP